MNIRNLMAVGVASLVALPIASTAALAQGPHPEGGPVMVMKAQAGKPGERSQAVFISSELSFEGKTVKGAPYTADTINESVQTLGDGNRIVSSNRGSIARDSEGRMRREHTISRFGPFAKSGEPSTMIFITDPVSSTNYIVDTNEKTVRKLPLPEVRVWHDEKAGDMNPEGVDVVVTVDSNAPEGATVVTKEIRGKGEPGPAIERIEGPVDGTRGDVVVVTTTAGEPGMGGTMRMRSANPGMTGPGPMAGGFRYEVTEMGEPKKESLGKKVVEGVECEGTRTTVTIAAGSIGNDRPIDIVSESWYSPELQVVVSSRHSDPRFGETSYRLANISRAEPDKSLFVPPADYKVEELPFKTMVRKSGKAGVKNE